MSVEQPHGPLPPTGRNGLDRWAALLAAVVSGVLGTLCVSLSVNVSGLYGLTLFVGLPVIVGAIAPLVYSYKVPLTSSWQAAKLSVVAGGVLCGSLLLMGSEGLLCILMSLPLCLPLTMLGGIFGYALLRAMTRHRSAFAAPLLLCCGFPIGLGVEWVRKPEPPLRSVTTEIEITGNPQQVWDALIAFTPITTPHGGGSVSVLHILSGQGLLGVAWVRLGTASFRPGRSSNLSHSGMSRGCLPLMSRKLRFRCASCHSTRILTRPICMACSSHAKGNFDSSLFRATKSVLSVQPGTNMICGQPLIGDRSRIALSTRFTDVYCSISKSRSKALAKNKPPNRGDHYGYR